MTTTFDITTSFLSDEEAERLYKKYPDLGESPETYCPTCRKEGIFKWKGKTWTCPCDQQLQLCKLYLSSGIGVPYQRLNWDDFEGADEIVEHLSKYLLDHKRFIDRGIGLFFQGPRGVGKTMLCILAMKELIQRGYKCFAATAQDTIDLLNASWHSDADHEYFHQKFMGSQVVLLDDLGRERETKWAAPTFDNIVRGRVQAGRPTFITTNLTDYEIESRYGAGILDHIRELSLDWRFADNNGFRPKSQKRTVTEVVGGETRPIV